MAAARDAEGGLASSEPVREGADTDVEARNQLTVLARQIVEPAALNPPSDVAVTLTAPIGEGGMAVVWSGQQTQLLRSVAVKIARRADVADQSRLLREARLTARLEHPNIVPVHDVVGDEGGCVRVVMKRLRGDPWSQLMTDGARVLERFGSELLAWNLRVLCDVARAAAFAHEHGIVHRDIKPSNVMIGAHGEVTLLDWGVAAAWGEGDPELPQLEDAPVAGTLAYMPPEQLEGDVDAQGPWSDVFLLGATLYQLLSGKAPFAAVDAEQARAQPRQRVYSPLDPQLPSELAALVEAALAQDVAERMLSADEFRSAIEVFLQHRDSTTIAASAARRLATGSGDEALLVEVEVGFRAALEIWSDNPTARRGLHAIALRRLELALEQGLPELAQSLLLPLEDVPPALRERVREALAAHAVQKLRASHALQQADVTHQAQRRRGLLLLFGPLWPLCWLGFALWPPRTLGPFALFFLVCLLSGTAVVLRQGSQLLEGQAHRTNVLGTALSLTTALLWVLVCVRLGLGREAVYLGVLLTLAGMLGLVALTYDRRAGVQALVTLGCFGLALAEPAAGPWAMVVATAAWALSAGMNNWRARQDAERRDET